MVRILMAAVVLASCFSAQAAEVRETRVPGDVNCDGEIDISDAVFVLVYLFSGTAEAPCPLADRPELVARVSELEAEVALQATVIAEKDAEIAQMAAENVALQTELEALLRRPSLPATGQTKCYDTAGTEIPCDNPDFPGQDGFYRAGCATEGRFTDNEDGTVTDSCTGLMWQKNTAIPTAADFTDGYRPEPDGRLNWRHSLLYCENLTLAGHDDWRVPNMRELQSIVNCEHRFPAIDPVLGAASGWHWSSSSNVALCEFTWIVDFFDGHVYDSSGNKGSGLYFVRAIRGGL
jgi:uncharacterized coiled-coil protein SlyX